MGQRGPKPLPANVHMLRGNASKKPLGSLFGSVLDMLHAEKDTSGVRRLEQMRHDVVDMNMLVYKALDVQQSKTDSDYTPKTTLDIVDFCRRAADDARSRYGKAVAINENYGFVKLVASESGRLLGAHMTGPHMTELIGAAAIVVGLGINVRDAAKVVFPHPTLGEALMEGLHALAGHAAHL